MKNEIDIYYHAWKTDKEWRERYTYGVQRDISKTGDLYGYEDFLKKFSDKMSKSEIIELFKECQRSNRPESEWKEGFLKIFTKINEDELPEPIVDEEEAEKAYLESLKESEKLYSGGLPDTGEIPF